MHEAGIARYFRASIAIVGNCELMRIADRHSGAEAKSKLHAYH